MTSVKIPDEREAARGYALTLLDNLERNLAKRRDERESLSALADEWRAAIPPAVAQRLDCLEAPHLAALTKLESDYAATARELLYVVRHLGESVEGELLRAHYIPAAPVWDVAGLEAYAATHPEIQRFRRNGRASAQLESLEE